jgi:hypothetical protein
MSPYWKFDPYKDLESETPAKVAKVAKADTGKITTLAGLATLAAPPAENANSSFLPRIFCNTVAAGNPHQLGCGPEGHR